MLQQISVSFEGKERACVEAVFQLREIAMMQDTNTNQEEYTPTPVSEVFARYFKDPSVPELNGFVQLAFLRLQEGHIATALSEKDVAVLSKSRFVSTSENDLSKPFIVYKQKLYLQRYFLYETKILQKISALKAAGLSQLGLRQKALQSEAGFIKQLFAGYQSDGSAQASVNWQMLAALNSALEQFSIITGGPGTGKTTTVASLLALLYKLNPSLRVCLAAQTGKAASRLKESLTNSRSRLPVDEQIKQSFDSIQPLTIHRLLGFRPGSVDFKHCSGNTLEYDLIVIDESSMIDVPLMAKLFDAVGLSSRIVLLGDKNQLASVEAGSVFGDLCKSAGEELNMFTHERISILNSFIEEAPIPAKYATHETGILLNVCELKRSYRFNATEGIGLLAKQILNGEEIQFSKYADKTLDEGARISESILLGEMHSYFDKYKEYILEPDIAMALRIFNEVKVLCASRTGKHGLAEMNQMVEQYLHQKKLIRRTDDFYENRPVLITKNDYSLGLFNGDVGICRKNSGGEIRVYFEDSESETGLKEIIPSFMQSFETLYAMTIHKSQGSEFTHVLMLLPEKGNAESLLTRELVYTGVTRARKTVYVIAGFDVFQKAVDTPVERVSGVVGRL